MICILLVLFAFAYFYLEGKREAYYWHYKIRNWLDEKNKELDYNGEHKTFLAQRILVFILSCGVNYFVVNHYILFSLGLLLSFSFIHNGTYYYYRNKLDNNIYHLKFKANSTTSNAVMEFDYETRLFMFIIGLFLITLNFVL